MKYYCLIIFTFFMSFAKAQNVEDDFLEGKLENPEEVITLFLENRNLTELPDTFEKLVNLESIYLSENQLTHLPKSITTLKKLKSLYLSENKLQELPENFGDLKSLESLVLTNNQLTFFDESICNLTNLDFLIVNKNGIKTIPDCIANLTKLNYLGISNNPLASAPTVITTLSNLITLSYEGKNIALPNLKSLKKLDKIFIDKDFYAKNKSTVKSLLPKGCKVNPKNLLPPPIVAPMEISSPEPEQTSFENGTYCFVNNVKTDTTNKMEVIENLLEFGYNNQLARFVISKTLHEGENIKQKIKDAVKDGMRIVGKMSLEFSEGTFAIENNVFIFTEKDSKTVKKFKISYKSKTKIINQLTEIGTSQVYKIGPCFAPMPSIGR